MNRPEPRRLAVKRVNDITPHFRRITLTGTDLATLPDSSAGTYIKLFFDRGTADESVRTYTIRAQRPEEIDVDFVLHGDGGPAYRWASGVRRAQRILCRQSAGRPERKIRTIEKMKGTRT